jgi:hypothetical protein
VLPRLQDRRDIVKARFGYTNGKGQTLRRIAHRFSLSAERIRQIIVDELRNMTVGKAGVALNLIRQRVDIILISAGCTVALKDLGRHDFFKTRRRAEVLCMVKLLSALFPNRYGVIDNEYLSLLDCYRAEKAKTDTGDVGKQFRQVLPANKTALCEGREGSCREADQRGGGSSQLP